MANKFFDSFTREAQTEKFHGKPLIRHNGFLQQAAILLRGAILSIVFIAVADLAAIGLMALTSAPVREFIFGR